MQLSFESQSQDTVASDRLRKAIERNRAKQAKRSAGPPPARPQAASASSTTRRSVAKVNDVEFTRDLVPTSKNLNQVSYTKAKRKVSTKKRAARRSSSDSIYVDYFVKACWVFAAVLIGRLIFSNGGVVDYYQSVSKLDQKIYQLERIQSENKELSDEIELIKKNSSYQKKIVRDYLGYIAKDEYLILFQQDRQTQTSM